MCWDFRPRSFFEVAFLKIEFNRRLLERPFATDPKDTEESVPFTSLVGAKVSSVISSHEEQHPSSSLKLT